MLEKSQAVVQDKMPGRKTIYSQVSRRTAQTAIQKQQRRKVRFRRWGSYAALTARTFFTGGSSDCSAMPSSDTASG